ncbi:hypothetical protein EYF80_043781 [Liparis tanakae]|uniref:Uncharacterized protein n=1 Tax=Liparis tanakae TaxID=230148 RepID=A0A4Z2FYU5_9TELE|nr:hypothetical protein EYF80_043781 [Liparis tanakae]
MPFHWAPRSMKSELQKVQKQDPKLQDYEVERAVGYFRQDGRSARPRSEVLTPYQGKKRCFESLKNLSAVGKFPDACVSLVLTLLQLTPARSEVGPNIFGREVLTQGWVLKCGSMGSGVRKVLEDAPEVVLGRDYPSNVFPFLAFEVFVAGELHALQALLSGLVRVGAVRTHAVAPRAVTDAHAGGEHEDLLAHHALLLYCKELLFRGRGWHKMVDAHHGVGGGERRVPCVRGLTRECLLTCSRRVNSLPQMSQLKERTPEWMIRDRGSDCALESALQQRPAWTQRRFPCCVCSAETLQQPNRIVWRIPKSLSSTSVDCGLSGTSLSSVETQSPPASGASRLMAAGAAAAAPPLAGLFQTNTCTWPPADRVSLVSPESDELSLSWLQFPEAPGVTRAQPSPTIVTSMSLGSSFTLPPASSSSIASFP